MEPTVPPPGRVPVLNSEVMAFAKKGCSICAGEGIHTVHVPDGTGRFNKKDELCPNALRRYFKANPEAKFELSDKKLYRPA